MRATINTVTVTVSPFRTSIAVSGDNGGFVELRGNVSQSAWAVHMAKQGWREYANDIDDAYTIARSAYESECADFARASELSANC